MAEYASGYEEVVKKKHLKDNPLLGFDIFI